MSPRALKPCGTRAAYERGCRCQACKDANARHQVQKMAKSPALREAHRLACRDWYARNGRAR